MIEVTEDEDVYRIEQVPQGVCSALVCAYISLTQKQTTTCRPWRHTVFATYGDECIRPSGSYDI